MYDSTGDGMDTEIDAENEAREMAKALRFGAHAVAAASVVAFVEGGQATFTLVNTRSGGRYTYRVVTPPPLRDGKPGPARFFVSVLNGPNNEADYAYIGCVYGDGSFRHGAKSVLAADAPSVRGFEWFWRHKEVLVRHPHVEVHHQGTCGRCGRALTVPESITTGLGPVCATKAAEGR